MAHTNPQRLPRTRPQALPAPEDRQRDRQAARQAKRDAMFVRGLFPGAGSNWGARVPAGR